MDGPQFMETEIDETDDELDNDPYISEDEE